MQTLSKLKSQCGAVLAFSLVMLLLLTLAATRMIQQNKQQLEMANSVRLLTQEFANAEGILAEAKNMINYHPAHDNCLPNDPRSCTDHSYFLLDSSGDPYTGTDGKEHYKYKLPSNDSGHQCIPTSTSYKQNILLAGTDLFSSSPLLSVAKILKVRCRRADGNEQICSSYGNGVISCNGKTPCTSVADAVNQFNSSTDLCYQDYDPQCVEDISTTTNPRCLTAPFPDTSINPPTCSGKFVYKKVDEIDKCVPPDASCPKEIYTIDVISTDANGTTREIISDHVVGCGT